MTTTVVVVCLVLLWVVEDCRTRHLPFTLMLGSALIATGWSMSQHAPWWYLAGGAMIGFIGSLIAGFPGGDRHALIVLGLLLGPERMVGVLVLTFVLLEGTLIVANMAHRSVVGWPLMPWIAAAVGCMLLAAPLPDW